MANSRRCTRRSGRTACFLYVPRGVAVSLPLHSIFYNTQPGMSLGHVLVVAEEGAQVTYLHEYLSAQDVQRRTWPTSA